MLLKQLILLFLCARLNNSLVFDYYTGKIASRELLDYYKQKGNLNVCTIEIAPCCATDRSRIDGSCNSIDNPAKGTFFSPPRRVLPASYYNGTRKAVTVKNLKFRKHIRRVLSVRQTYSEFTQAMPGFGMFMLGDVASICETSILKNKLTCFKKGPKDHKSLSFKAKKDWPITEKNLMRPISHQYFGCTNDSIPSPIAAATSVFDLSQIYKFNNNEDKVVRSFEDGKLIMEVKDGKTYPANGPNYPLDEASDDIANYPTAPMQVTLFVVWFARLHNYFTTQLAVVNPWWDDDTLFHVARDMNIAFAMQMYLYECLAQLQGFENLAKSSVISKLPGFRNIYDVTKYPTVSLEFTFILHWLHTVKAPTTKMYNINGTYLREYTMFNHTFTPEYLAKDKNMEYLTQGIFRQPCNENNSTGSYKEVEYSLPSLQLSSDIVADLHTGRLLGIRPYVDYIYYCTGHNVKTFKDLYKHIDKDKIYLIRKLYKKVADIDLLAGILVEKQLKGGKIPRTLACLLNDNILEAIKGDRHWYESPDRPYAFTSDQLKEIRKASLALLLCTVGDDVTEIQKDAFLNISPRNPLVKCHDIPAINFTAWTDL